MHQLLIILVLGAAYCRADEPFSIGLGVLSPSYSQTVGKENVKVTFDQKDNGFSYSVGDPKSGTNTYLNFGPSAPQQNAPSGYAAPAAAQPAYQAPSYGSNQGSSGGYGAAQPAYQAPSYGSNQGSSGGYGAAREQQQFLPAGFSYHATEGQAYLRQGGELRKPEASPNQILPAGFSYHATEGQSFLRQGGELRKPEGNQGQILPAGFSYHATEGQSFLKQGDSPNFMIGVDKQNSARGGPAEQSFYNNFRSGSQQGGPGLVNGLVGYGQGGSASGSLPIGGYAGAQFSGGFKEHGGHE